MSHTRNLCNPLVILDDVTLRVGPKVLFEHTSWTIQSDQHWAIIGPNGSGKSILANALCRKVTVIHGQILYFFDRDSANTHHARPFLNRGEVVRISPDAHRELMQTQGGYHQARWQSIEGKDAPTVSDLLSGKSIEHISPYEVTPFRVSEEVYQARRRQAVELLGIEYLLERKILHVSHGEARKVLIARAVMQSPKLLILDDPFGGLDNASRDILKKTIEDVLATGSPQILLVTSRADEIPDDITHILRVADNRVVDKGPKSEMLHTEIVQESSSSQKRAKRMSPPHFPVVSQDPIIKHPVLIEMKATSVSYGDVDVLRNINWTMRQGENWAVLGPNGAGKTTLLSLILADNPQSYANEITIFGRRRGSGESIWDIKRDIGWVSPELQLYYHSEITCHSVICSGFFDSVGLYQICLPEQTDVAKQWMISLGITDLAEHPLGTVSVGEQRLVLLARALVKSPILLILDEPCQGLDFSNRQRIIELLDQLCLQTPVNLIYVTHHFDEMPKAITHVLKLEQGQIQDSGPRRSVLGW